MVRRRGGGTGQGQGGQGGKRQATTPVGGTYKDSRRNIQGDEEYDEEEEWTQVIHNKRNSPPVQSGSGSGQQSLNQPESSEQERNTRPTFASIAGQGTSMQARRDSAASAAAWKERKTLESKFRTPDPEGPMRDDIIVEIRTVNDRPFKGSLTFTEAKDGVFATCMGMSIGLLHGIRFDFSTYPVVKFKLKEQMDVDKHLHHVEYFNYERRYKVEGKERTDILGCKIRGIRSGSETTNQPDPDPNIRWVKVEWVNYTLEKTDILDWLNYFGEQAGDLTEDVHQNSDSDADPFGMGTYSIKMRLRQDIPQLLPMWGKRVRIYHRGIQKLCSNCFGAHPRRNCRSEKVPWTRYVLNFMERCPEIPPELYGRWWKIINDEYGEIIEETNQDRQESENVTTESQPKEIQSQGNQTSSGTQISKDSTMTREEESNLSDYLNLGMSLVDARAAYKIEVEAAELRLKIRENQRAQQRGSVNQNGRTYIGPTRNNRGTGRGGLSFN